MTEKEKEVMKILKEKGKLSTSRIGAIVGMNTERAKILLEMMEKEKKIKKLEETIATYWELK